MNFINAKVRANCEEAMKSFWPDFTTKRFLYKGWVGDVIAKVKSEGEFRSAFVFRFKEDPYISYIFPGKVSNIFSAANEVSYLLRASSSQILENTGVEYLKNGTLHKAENEFKRKIITRNTLDLQTFSGIYKRKNLQGILHNKIFIGIVIASIGYVINKQVNTDNFALESLKAIMLLSLSFIILFIVVKKNNVGSRISRLFCNTETPTPSIYGDFLENPISYVSTNENRLLSLTK